MGVVQRQSIKASLVKYLSLTVGMLSSIFIYPFGIELYGFLSFVQDTVLLILPFTLLGIPQAGLKYFPYFKNKDKRHHDFLSFIILLGFLGALLFSIGLLIFQSQIIEHYFYKHQGQPWLNFQLIIKIIILLFLWNLDGTLKTYCVNFKRIAIQSIIDLMLKTGMGLIVLSYIYFQWSFSFCLDLFLFLVVLTNLTYIIYIYRMGELFFGKSFIPFFKKEGIARAYAELSIYSILGGIATFVISRIDLVMVGSLSSLDTTGVYKISIVIASIALIPFRMLSNVSVPIVASYLKDKDYDALEKIYKNISVSSLIFGIFLAILILESIDIFYVLHPKGAILKEGYWVVTISLITVVLNMGTSINSWILAISKLFRVNLWTTIFIASVNVILNYIFIQKWGIIGVTIATLIASVLMNGFNLTFVYRELKITPFDIKAIYLFIISAILYVLFFWLLPFQSQHIVKLIYIGLFSIAYIYLIYRFKISKDVNNLINKTLARFG